MGSLHSCDNGHQWGESARQIWFAQLLLLFSYKTRQGCAPFLAFVFGFTPARKPAHAKGIKLTALTWAMIKIKGIRAQVFWTNIVQHWSLLIQPDAVDKIVFNYTHWIGNDANDDP